MKLLIEELIEMETEAAAAGAKSFLIRDLLRDLIVKNSENDETSDNDDSGKLIDQNLCNCNLNCCL